MHYFECILIKLLSNKDAILSSVVYSSAVFPSEFCTNFDAPFFSNKSTRLKLFFLQALFKTSFQY